MRIIRAWRAGDKATPGDRAMLQSWRFSRLSRAQLDKLPRPPAPKTAPAYDAEQRQTIARTILDLWPPDEEDEDEYLEGLLRIAGFAIRGGAPVLAVEISMLRRVRPAEPESTRGFFVRVL